MTRQARASAVATRAQGVIRLPFRDRSLAFGIPYRGTKPCVDDMSGGAKRIRKMRMIC
jgi:hypothetical protein